MAETALAPRITPEHFAAPDACWPAPDVSPVAIPGPASAWFHSIDVPRHRLEEELEAAVHSPGFMPAELVDALIEALDHADGDFDCELNGDELERSEVAPAHFAAALA